MKKYFAVIIILFLFASCCHSEKENAVEKETQQVSAINYADTAYWYSCGDTVMPADIFYVYPTVATVSFADNDSSWFADIALPEVREEANGNQRFNKMLYEGYNFYAPYYRQMIFDAYQHSDSCVRSCAALPAGDIKAAFQYYMEHYNQDRPFFLLGHSQGSQMLVELLKDGMTAEQRRLMVAAYCIGWSITEEELAAYPEQLVPATDSCSTGTIVIFNSVTDLKGTSPMFENTVVGINPLSWTTDTAFVPREAHLGMAKYNDSRDSIVLYPAFTGGQLQHHMMVCTDVDSALVFIPAYQDFFPMGNLHFADSWLFAGNVKQNMACRLRWFQVNQSRSPLAATDS